MPSDPPHPEDCYAAWLRCSDEELQNPELSLDRQLRNCTAAVERWGGQIVAVYYDIESGAVGYHLRGLSDAAQRFNLPIVRAGGLPDLMRAATTPLRGFNRVVCESIDRLARNSVVAFTLDEQLRDAGVRLHCADEPFEESFGSILLRHVNVGLARGYHHNMLAKSRQGLETGTRQGWHMGGPPCYGYQFVEHPHPNPNKAREGAVRRTLELHQPRARVVRQIFDWYLDERRSVRDILELLKADPDRYPPPAAPRGAGTWVIDTVRYILCQPKYTGYQVWNRRTRANGHDRLNPPEQWVWSQEPAHPAIITREEFDRVKVVAQRNVHDRLALATAGKTTAAAARGSDLQTPLLFDGLLDCGRCGGRLRGRPYRGRIIYTCHATRRCGGNPERPQAVALREEQLVAAVIGYLATEFCSPARLARWRGALPEVDLPALAALEASQDAEAAGLGDLELQLRQGRLSRAAFRDLLAARLATLDAELAREHAVAQAARLDFAALDRLLAAARTRSGLPSQPALRALLDSLQLGGVYHPDRHEVALTVTLPHEPQDHPEPQPVTAA